MDPVSLAIIVGLAEGVASSAIELAYETLKATLKRKSGPKSDLVEAVGHLEKKPEAKSRQTGVAGEVKATKADHDPEVLAAAEALLTALQLTPEGRQAISKYQITVQGDVGIIGDKTKIERDFQVGGSQGDA